MAATSPATKLNEETLTYLNQGGYSWQSPRTKCTWVTCKSGKAADVILAWLLFLLLITLQLALEIWETCLYNVNAVDLHHFKAGLLGTDWKSIAVVSFVIWYGTMGHRICHEVITDCVIFCNMLWQVSHMRSNWRDSAISPGSGESCWGWVGEVLVT